MDHVRQSCLFILASFYRNPINGDSNNSNIAQEDKARVEWEWCMAIEHNIREVLTSVHLFIKTSEDKGGRRRTEYML